MAFENNASIDFLLTIVEMKIVFASDDSVDIEHDRLFLKLNWYKIGSEQFKKLILKKCAAMKAISSCFQNMEKQVLSIETEKGNLLISNSKQLATAKLKEASSAH